MKNVLILHGAANNSSGNWFPWLKTELKKKGIKVWSPNLPHPNKPVLKEWLDTVFTNKDWEFNDQSIMIGHSSGATLILRILEKLPLNIKIDKAILVAGPLDKGEIEEYQILKEDITKDPYDFEKIRNSCSKFYLVYSDNDPYDCGQRHGKVLQEKLGGQLIIKKGEGHFNLEKGPQYRQFPELIELVGD